MRAKHISDMVWYGFLALAFLAMSVRPGISDLISTLDFVIALGCGWRCATRAGKAMK